jgi:hypothetical protein
MAKSVHITAPPLSREEMAKRLHISQARQKELQAILDEAEARFSGQLEERAESVEPEKRRKRASAA